MNVSVNGIGSVVITAKIFGEIALGDFVTMKANGQVQKAATEADPVGVCASKNGEYIAVIIGGGTVVKCEDATLTVGFSPIKVTAARGIAKAASGKLRLITAVDSVMKTAEIIL